MKYDELFIAIDQQFGIRFSSSSAVRWSVVIAGVAVGSEYALSMIVNDRVNSLPHFAGGKWS